MDNIDPVSSTMHSSKIEYLDGIKPTKPKRPMTAYNFFFRDQRLKLVAEAKKRRVAKEKECEPDKKTERPSKEEGVKKKRKRKKQEISFEDLGRIIGQRWRDLSDKEFAPYEAMAEADSERYKKEMKKYHEEELTSICKGYNHYKQAPTEQKDVKDQNYPTPFSPPVPPSKHQGADYNNGDQRGIKKAKLVSKVSAGHPRTRSEPKLPCLKEPSMDPSLLMSSITQNVNLAMVPSLDTPYQQTETPLLPESVSSTSSRKEVYIKSLSPLARAKLLNQALDPGLTNNLPFSNEISALDNCVNLDLKNYLRGKMASPYALVPPNHASAYATHNTAFAESLKNLCTPATTMPIRTNLLPANGNMSLDPNQQAIQFYVNEIRRLKARLQVSHDTDSPGNSE